MLCTFHEKLESIQYLNERSRWVVLHCWSVYKIDRWDLLQVVSIYVAHICNTHVKVPVHPDTGTAVVQKQYSCMHTCSTKTKFIFYKNKNKKIFFFNFQ